MLMCFCGWFAILLCLVPCSRSVPRYRLGLLIPTDADVKALGIPYSVSRQNIWRTYNEAILDVNAYFGQNFTLYGSWKSSSTDSETLPAAVLYWLSDSWPTIALIGPFILERLKFIAPLAEINNVPLISPLLTRSEMLRFLPHNRFVLSMQAAKNTYGEELFDFFDYHGWTHIALVITKSSSQHVGEYERNVKNVLYLSRQHGVQIEAIAWIPPAQDFGNDTTAFEKAVGREMVKIWESGATVIALSIEQTPPTYAAVLRAADERGLVNEETAWISLHFGSFSELKWNIYYNKEIWKLAQGMITTKADLAGMWTWLHGDPLQYHVLLS